MSHARALRFALTAGLFVGIASWTTAGQVLAQDVAGGPVRHGGSALDAASAGRVGARGQDSKALRSGFELLASVAYGASTGRVAGLELEPYGATFGIEPGYIWGTGFRLGVYFDYGVGRAIEQHQQPRSGSGFNFTADTSSLITGLSLGYDLKLYFLVLRYTLDLGLSRMSWDLSGIPVGTLLGLTPEHGSDLGFHLAPGLSVLWPFGRFECGLGVEYLVQTADLIPAGILGKLLLGVRL